MKVYRQKYLGQCEHQVIMCILTINIVIHPALRNNMGDTKRAKISNSNKNFRTFKCKILISII